MNLNIYELYKYIWMHNIWIYGEELHAVIEEDSSQMCEMLAQRFAINDKTVS